MGIFFLSGVGQVDVPKAFLEVTVMELFDNLQIL